MRVGLVKIDKQFDVKKDGQEVQKPLPKLTPSRALYNKHHCLDQTPPRGDEP